MSWTRIRTARTLVIRVRPRTCARHSQVFVDDSLWSWSSSRILGGLLKLVRPIFLLRELRGSFSNFEFNRYVIQRFLFLGPESIRSTLDGWTSWMMRVLEIDRGFLGDFQSKSVLIAE